MTTKFVLGKDPYPLWFDELGDRVSYKTKEDGTIISAEIQKIPKPITALNGDTILWNGGNILAIPAKAIEEYGGGTDE